MIVAVRPRTIVVAERMIAELGQRTIAELEQRTIAEAEHKVVAAERMTLEAEHTEAAAGRYTPAATGRMIVEADCMIGAVGCTTVGIHLEAAVSRTRHQLAPAASTRELLVASTQVAAAQLATEEVRPAADACRSCRTHRNHRRQIRREARRLIFALIVAAELEVAPALY